jgi:hypothetical protein
MIDTLLIAKRVEDGQFVYVRPSTVDANPDAYIPYDFKMQKLASKSIRTYADCEREGLMTFVTFTTSNSMCWLRVPTEPTKQSQEI